MAGRLGPDLAFKGLREGQGDRSCLTLCHAVGDNKSSALGEVWQELRL